MIPNKQTNGSETVLLANKEQLVALIGGSSPVRCKVPASLSATILSDLNGHNRPVYPGTVKAYAQAMKAGDWIFTGDPIRFYGSGQLADGQHRLSAAVEAVFELDVVIVPQFPDAGIHRIDGAGRKRTPAESLALERVENPDIVSGAIGLILRFVENHKTSPTKLEVTTYYIANKAPLELAIAFALDLDKRFPNQVALAGREVAAVHYAALKAGCEKANIETFLADVVEGLDDENNMAARLGSELAQKRREPAGPTAKQRWAAIVECFGMFTRGVSAKTIRALSKRGNLVVPEWPHQAEQVPGTATAVAPGATR